MSYSSVAAFETYRDADLAASKLVDAGFTSTTISIHGGDTGVNKAGSPTAAAHAANGPLDKIEQFFSRLFGTQDYAVHSAGYATAISNGDVLLTVENVPDSKIHILDALLVDAGALNIEDRSTTDANSTSAQTATDSVVADIPREILPHYAFGKKATPSGKAHLYTEQAFQPASTPSVNPGDTSLSGRRSHVADGSASQPYAAEMSIKDIAEEMRDIDFTMMYTTALNGALAGRPMSNNKEVDYQGTSWYFTDDATTAVAGIARNSQVGLAYQGKPRAGGAAMFISVEGTASLIRDRAVFREHWHKGLDAWFPQGIETAGLILIRVEANTLHWWQGMASGEVGGLM